ncbi:integrase catalytic domain-containing protein [Trichonephila clavipes]|nr:integrase catalytic domain-containing protein [Trichonephila clavipes]
MRFGQEDVLIQVYVRELLKLVLQNAEVNKVNLSSLYDKIEAQLRALESLGVTKEKYAAMLFPLVKSCLPVEILRAWERYVGYSSDESGLETESASIENSTTASSSSSNVLANQACTSEVLLQTLVVMLQNGNHKSLVRALIDTGSQKSYISKSTTENLGFKYEGEEEFVHSLFGGSKTKMKLAENRLESTKRKLIATGKFEEYQDVLDLWLSGKIVEEVNDDKENFVHYLPHRPVIKENSTSKIRPVFDASARTKGSPSLNDCLEKGPNFIEVIPTILNRFRKYKIGVISDIEKAFLQIGVREQDRDFLRFMWVKEIRNLSDVSSWEHVPSEKNFADILSWGCSAQQLVYLRWWEGPSWLSESPVQCPRSKQVPDEEAVNLELRKSVLVNTAKRIEEFNWHSEYFSSYLKVVRMIAWIFRFFKNAKRIDVCNTSEITFSEFDHAEKTVIKLIQMEKFEGVTDEKLRPLKPFLDEFGILRARTKLSFREGTHNFKFPIILPNEHPVVHLMIVRKHEELMHAGVSIVMNHLRESFWILKARKLIRQIIQKCTRCKRFSAQKTEVVPSSLPKDRVSNSKIFQVVGVDLAGPLHLKDRRKGWVVLFTCAVFRAVHFELITSLSTAAFLQSLRRFISRRGRPTIIYSDNGTNFVGSNSGLNSIDWDVVISKANIQKIKWKFNPSSAAWWGGFWERMIQMLKQILRKIPLTYISEDVNDLSPLTPAMFLQEIETSDVTDIDCLDHQEINKRIRHAQTIREQLRKRFRVEYLGQLREQTQHHRKLRPLTVGEVVVVENSLKNRTLWSLARVIQLIPGKDGHVRVARVKTETGELVRPVKRLYNLELQEPETKLPKDLTDSVIRTRRGRKVISPKRLTYA